MSSTTWTPRALESEAADYALPLWRAVEAQHVVATRALVDTLDEQAVLEQILDDAKPPVPAACARLDYLLFTPFRYPPTRGGSRFRDLVDPGVWYGADAIATACAEVGYWRSRFVAASAGLQRLDGVAHTIFRATARGIGIDLRQPPLVRDDAEWTAPDDYGPCQRIARVAREAELRIIRYRSARDPAGGACAAVLDCRAFAGGGGIKLRQTWFLTADAKRATWVRADTRPGAAESHEYVWA